MRHGHVINLLRIASSIEASNPLLALELERSALAVINPGAKKFEDHIRDAVEILENLKSELEKADKQLDTEDAAEFAKFFDDEAKAQTEELRQMLKVSCRLMRLAADDDNTAGIMDKVKGFFKKDKKKEKEHETEEKPSGYQMSEKEMDEFVEGDRDWTDAGPKVEKERKENQEFFEDVDNVVKLLDKVRDNPSRAMVRSILSDIKDLIAEGLNFIEGKRYVDKVPKAKDLLGDEQEQKPAEKQKPSTQGLEGTVTQYMSILNDIEGDDAKLVKTLKEFFNKVKPHLEEDRASLASKRAKILPLLVRTASANPRVRPVLLPVIRRWTGR